VTYLFRLFSFGLIAYVTNDPVNPNQIKLLLVDARHPPVGTDGCPISKHEPLLIYAPHAGKCEDWCRLEMGVCRCPLERVRILFDFELSPVKDATIDHREMKYVPSVHQMMGRGRLAEIQESGSFGPESGMRHVKPECLYRRTTRVCPFVTAQAEVTPKSIHTCEMAGGMEQMTTGVARQHYSRPKWGDTVQSGRPFVFRSPSQNHYEMLRPRQYVAIKQVMVSDIRPEKVTSDPTGKEYVEVSVVSYDNTEEPTKIRIYPVNCPASTTDNPQECFDLAIADVPFHADQHLLYGRCQGHGLDRDFELFEDLTTTQHDLQDRDVPFDRGAALNMKMKRDVLCDSVLLEDFNRWLRTDQATSECSGGKIRN
jgi:hypothetical protein